MNPENALIERTVVRRTDDVVELREVWDMKHPECPFVSTVFKDEYHHRILMHPTEYDRIKPTIKKPEGS